MPLFDNLLLSVGAMKAGTSWLYEMLKNHPDIDTVPVKEIHYFWEIYGGMPMLGPEQRKDAICFHFPTMLEKCPPGEFDQLFDWIKSYLTGPVDDAWFAGLFHARERKRYCAEFSNMAALLPAPAWQHMRRITENIRILYTLRDPLQRLWSHARYHAAVNGGLDQLNGWNRQAFSQFLVHSGCIANGRYSQVLQHLRDHFEPAEYLVLSFAEIESQPRQLLGKVERFLGLAPFDYLDERIRTVHNASASLAPPPAFIEAARPIIAEELKQLSRLDFAVPDGWV